MANHSADLRFRKTEIFLPKGLDMAERARHGARIDLPVGCALVQDIPGRDMNENPMKPDQPTIIALADQRMRDTGIDRQWTPSRCDAC
jgi:hypothetical protein